MGQGVQVGGSVFAGIRVGVYPSTNGRYRAVDDDGAFGAGPQYAVDWVNEALGWANDYTNHKLTPNTRSLQDVYPLDNVVRRKGTGKRTLRMNDTGGGGGVITFGPFDVVVMFVKDPKPGSGESFFAYTDPGERGDGTWEIRIDRDLGNPVHPPPWNTKEFFMETVWHELGHFVLGMIAENHGNIGRLRKILGGGAWNTGAWDHRTLEGGAESFKDMFFSGRQYDNRTTKKLNVATIRDFGNLFIADAYTPHSGAGYYMGDVAKDLVESYTAPVDGWPIPLRPKWVWHDGAEGGFHGPSDFDYPAIGGGHATPFLGNNGGSLLWGGNASNPGFPLGPPGPSVFPDGKYRRPPKPGTKLKLMMEWFEPVAPMPEGFQHQQVDPQQKSASGHLPPGVYPFPLGEPVWTGLDSIDRGGAMDALSQGGIVWAAGGPGDTQYKFTLPQEAAGWPTYPFLDIWFRVQRRFVPVYLDFRTPHKWEFELTVPEHKGELELCFTWPSPWISIQNNTSFTIAGHYPIRCHPQGMLGKYFNRVWTVASPDLGSAKPYVAPQGDVIPGRAEPGTVREAKRIVGIP